MRDYATENNNGSGLKYRIEYAPASSTQSDWEPGMVNVYEDVELTGSFANWNEDRSSNVGFQAHCGEGWKRFRYDSVRHISLMR
jgi:hypothetical protein